MVLCPTVKHEKLSRVDVLARQEFHTGWKACAAEKNFQEGTGGNSQYEVRNSPALLSPVSEKLDLL
jgi:hypothetical protein